MNLIKKHWINFVRNVIEWNEKLIFNRRLKVFYQKFRAEDVKVIVDVGANIGQSIDFFTHLFPAANLHAFEPNPTLFERIKKKYANRGNIRLYQQGVSNQVGELTFHENVLHSTSSFEKVDLDSDYLKNKARVLGVQPTEIIADSYPVSVTTLAAFFERESIKRVDILKIDVEGHELACLQGLFGGVNLPIIRFIQLENHLDDMYTSNVGTIQEKPVDQLLKRYDYFPVAVIKHGFGDFEEVIYSQQGIS